MKVALFGLPKRAVRFIPKLTTERCSVSALFLSEPYESYFPQIEALAEAYKIPCVFPADPTDASLPSRLKQLETDLLVSINFTKRIPRAVLETPPRGAVNLHPSLLPKYRGPNPYYWVIRNGEKETGVTAHFMEEDFDTGPIIVQRPVPITTNDTLGSLLAKLEEQMEHVLLEVLHLFATRNPVPSVPQDGSAASVALQVKETDFRLSFTITSDEILRRIRAANPAYGAWCTAGGKVVKIFCASKFEGIVPLKSAGTSFVDRGRPAVVTRDSAVFLDVLLLEDGGFYTGADLVRLGLLTDNLRFE